METAIDKVNPEIIQRLVLDGDLSRMNQKQKVDYYEQFCSSLGLNPLTQPFQIIRFQGKERLYATKDATEQLRKLYKVSILDLDKLFNNDLYVVTAKAKDGSGRTDASTGVVNIKGLQGDNLANAIMKAETKAKRRVTLSICGLGMLDESELDTMPEHTINKVDENPKTRNYTEEAKECKTLESLHSWAKNKLTKQEAKTYKNLLLERESEIIDALLEKIKSPDALEVLFKSLTPNAQTRYKNRFNEKKDDFVSDAVIVEETDKDMFGNISPEKQLEIDISKLTKTSNFESVDASISDIKDPKDKIRLAKLLFDKVAELGVSYNVESVAF